MRPQLEHIVGPPDVSWRYHVLRAPKFGAHWHFHPEIELTLITAGSGTRIIGDSVENYRPGDLTLIGSELPHSYASAPGQDHHEALVIHFRHDFLGPEFLLRPEFSAIGELVAAARRGLTIVAEPSLVTALRMLESGPATDRTLGLLRCLHHLADEPGLRTLTTATAKPPVSEAGRDRADAVHTYLSEAYTGPVHLADVAAVAHMAPSAFSRFFRRTFGRTLTDYVTELRIAAACRLLSETELPVAEVAARSGYENLSNFNRRFRALKGTTPREYRHLLGDRTLGHLDGIT